jgi:hypothetical protein
MPPIVLLGILLAITAGAVGIDRWFRHRDQTIYRDFANEHRMHYSPRDPLRLTARVAAQLPIPGAAGVRVIDLMYRTDELNHYYIFTAEYTVGVVGPKRRVRRVAACTESKAGGGISNPVQLAPAELPLIEQYRAMMTGQAGL